MYSMVVTVVVADPAVVNLGSREDEIEGADAKQRRTVGM